MFGLGERFLALKYSDRRVELAETRLELTSEAKKNALKIRELDAQTERNKAEIRVIEAAYHSGLRQLRANTSAAIAHLKDTEHDGDPRSLLGGVESKIRARLTGGRNA